MEAAALMAIVLANGGGRPPDWQDFVGIIALLFINSTISFIEENNAGNAAAALMAGLAPKTKVKAEHTFHASLTYFSCLSRRSISVGEDHEAFFVRV